VKPVSFAIIGAGIGGLATAALLLRAGHRVQVFEQAARFARVGSGIQMAPNAVKVLRHLGIEARLRDTAFQADFAISRSWDSGTETSRLALGAEVERQFGAPYLFLHRADLHEILAAKAQELKPNLIHLNHRGAKFVEREDGVEMHFTNGAVARGDILVACDGLKSAIRAQMFGDASSLYTGDAAWRITVPSERLPQPFLEQVMSVFMGPGGHAVVYYLRGGKLINFVGLIETEEVFEESWTMKFSWDKLKKDFEGWHPAIQTIIDLAEKDQCYRWSLHGRQPLHDWSSKRVTLLGDSAHPTLPYLAQGAAMSIEDGAVLARALAMRDSIPEALQLYQRNRIDRTAKIVTQSTANRALFHLPSVQAMRDAFAKRNEGEDRNAWLYSYNPLTVELV
jgi:salicylate hydroxylase